LRAAQQFHELVEMYNYPDILNTLYCPCSLILFQSKEKLKFIIYNNSLK